jgi:hypothetical protein
LWSSLTDYPFKECRELNVYINESVKTCWSLLNHQPPFKLEHSTMKFDASAHKRANEFSDPRSDKIRQYVWPALVDTSNNACLFKAIVITWFTACICIYYFVCKIWSYFGLVKAFGQIKSRQCKFSANSAWAVNSKPNLIRVKLSLGLYSLSLFFQIELQSRTKTSDFLFEIFFYFSLITIFII